MNERELVSCLNREVIISQFFIMDHWDTLKGLEKLRNSQINTPNLITNVGVKQPGCLKP